MANQQKITAFGQYQPPAVSYQEQLQDAKDITAAAAARLPEATERLQEEIEQEESSNKEALDRLKSAKDVQGRLRADTEQQARLLDSAADSVEKLTGRKLQVLTDTFVGMQIQVARAEERTRATKRELKKAQADLAEAQRELKGAKETAKAEAKQEAEALAKTLARDSLDEFKKVAHERQQEAIAGNRQWLEEQLKELKEQHRLASSEALEKQLKKQFDEFQGKIAQSEGLKDLFEDQFALLKGGIDEIKTSRNASALDSVAEQLGKVSSAVDSIQKKCGPIQGLEEMVKDLKLKVMAVSTKTNIFPTGSSWDKLKESVDAIVEALPDIGKGVKSLGDTVSGIPGGIDTLKESVRCIEEGVREAREKDLPDLLEAVGDIGGELPGLEQQVAQTDEKVRKLHKDLSELRDTEISGIQMNLTVVKDTVPGIADTVEKLGQPMLNLQTGIKNVDEQLPSLQSTVSGLQEEMQKFRSDSKSSFEGVRNDLADSDKKLGSIEGKISDEIAQKSALTEVGQMQKASGQKLDAIEQSISAVATASALTEVRQMQDKSAQKLEAIKQSVSGVATASALTEVEQKQATSGQKLEAIEQSISAVATASALAEVRQMQEAIEQSVSDVATASALTEVEQKQATSGQKLEAIEQSISHLATASTLTEVKSIQEASSRKLQAIEDKIPGDIAKESELTKMQDSINKLASKIESELPKLQKEIPGVSQALESIQKGISDLDSAVRANTSSEQWEKMQNDIGTKLTGVTQRLESVATGHDLDRLGKLTEEVRTDVATGFMNVQKVQETFDEEISADLKDVKESQKILGEEVGNSFTTVKESQDSFLKEVGNSFTTAKESQDSFFKEVASNLDTVKGSQGALMQEVVSNFNTVGESQRTLYKEVMDDLQIVKGSQETFMQGLSNIGSKIDDTRKLDYALELVQEIKNSGSTNYTGVIGELASLTKRVEESRESIQLVADAMPAKASQAGMDRVLQDLDTVREACKSFKNAVQDKNQDLKNTIQRLQQKVEDALKSVNGEAIAWSGFWRDFANNFLREIADGQSGSQGPDQDGPLILEWLRRQKLSYALQEESRKAWIDVAFDNAGTLCTLKEWEGPHTSKDFSALDAKLLALCKKQGEKVANEFDAQEKLREQEIKELVEREQKLLSTLQGLEEKYSRLRAAAAAAIAALGDQNSGSG
ncbi:hypothetical protein BFW01_g4772 [Lasiodiplodia theobromae]|nr:hypothetical protein BFW01_g4772 [Lasiodiplodia theobromae]